jgi:hypothetical protein
MTFKEAHTCCVVMIMTEQKCVNELNIKRSSFESQIAYAISPPFIFHVASE